MTIAKLKTILESIDGFKSKVAFHSFPEKEVPPLPFICFIADDDNNFSADGTVYYSATNFKVELYTKYKDEAVEKKVEQAFKEKGFYYGKESTYLEDERVWMIIYEMEL